MATNTNANIGFEKQIWDAACVLRGNMDASEYKSVVLGLIFLKYISDRFEAKYNALVEEGDGYIVSSGVPHSCVAVGDVETLDIFSPAKVFPWMKKDCEIK